MNYVRSHPVTLMSKPMRKNTKQILKVKTKKRTNPKQEKKMVKIGLIVIDAMQGATITWAKKQLSFRLSVQPDSDTYFTPPKCYTPSKIL